MTNRKQILAIVLFMLVFPLSLVWAQKTNTEKFYVPIKFEQAFGAITTDSGDTGIRLFYNITLEEYEAIIRGDYKKPENPPTIQFPKNVNQNEWLGKGVFEVVGRGRVESFGKTGKTRTRTTFFPNRDVSIPVGSLGITISGTISNQGILIINNEQQQRIIKAIDTTLRGNNARAIETIKNSRVSVSPNNRFLVHTIPNTNFDLTNIPFISETIASVQSQVTEQRERVAAERQAEQQRQEAEKQREIQSFNEQVQRLVKLDGTYMPTGQSNWLAIRFIIPSPDLGFEEVRRIAALIIYKDRQRLATHYIECILEGSNLKVGNLSITVSNNKNSFQIKNENTGEIGTFTFNAFTPVAGKTYIPDGVRTETYQFINSSQYNAIDSSGRNMLSPAFESFYTYSNGIIWFYLRPSAYAIANGEEPNPAGTRTYYRWQIGPYLTDGNVVWRQK